VEIFLDLSSATYFKVALLAGIQITNRKGEIILAENLKTGVLFHQK
jgi:hypothetical protein